MLFDLSDLVQKTLLVLILGALLGLLVMIHQLPARIAYILPLSCGDDRHPCETRGLVSLDNDTMKELETRLKPPSLHIPEPCGRRNTPCFVIIEQ